MRNRTSNYLGLLLSGCMFLLCFGASIQAQTNIGLSIQLYAGLSVTGVVGKVYQVQYAYGLSETNTWYALQHFELKWNPHGFVDTTCPADEKRFYRAVEVEVPTNVVPVANMVFIPPGTFMMGSPTNEPVRRDHEGPETVVTISRGFWIGKYEVTQAEYAAVIGDNPSWFRNGTPAMGYGTGGPVTNELRHPVEEVSWNQAWTYCEQLTAQEVAAGRLPPDYAYRLPTEAEWEYACRAGTREPYHCGNMLHSGMVNFDGTKEYPPCGHIEYWCDNPSGIYLGRTREVGSYAPNPWGLYDMHGNVWEWCRDGWSDHLPGGNVTDPIGSGSGHVDRGGDWESSADRCRSAARENGYLVDRYGDKGFRIVLAFED